MRVYVKPTCTPCSLAMHRVSGAMEKYKPSTVRIVDDPAEADVQVLHTIGPWPAIPDKPFAVIQYCSTTAGDWSWSPFWRRARLVWSYYELPISAGTRFMRAPLGVDGDVFVLPEDGARRDIGIMSSGYVSHPAAEAIEEVAEAALRLGLPVVHLGPADIAGMARRTEPTWSWKNGIDDKVLAALYGRCEWVSGLRHGECFELPVIEGLACGARPIVFDRPEMRWWYGPHASFVKECDGEELVKLLMEVMSKPAAPVSLRERSEVLRTFSWERVVREFWRRL